MGNLVALVLYFMIRKVIPTLDSSKIIIVMVKENIFGKMEIYMKETLLKIK
jgi:hypothetical protein